MDTLSKGYIVSEPVYAEVEQLSETGELIEIRAMLTVPLSDDLLKLYKIKEGYFIPADVVRLHALNIDDIVIKEV